MRRIGRWVLPALVLTAACGGDGDGDRGADRPGTTTSSSTTTAADGGEVAEVAEVDDWLAGDLSVDLGGGFTLAHCEGDAPILCVTRGSEPKGIVELSSFPVASLDLRRALSSGPRAALMAHVDDYLGSLRADRIAGCGDGYTVTPLPTTITDGPEGPVASYGFTGARRGEAISVRTAQWAAIRGEELVLLNLSGYDDGACVPAEGEGSVADTVEVERRLRPLVEANPLPEEVGPPS